MTPIKHVPIVAMDPRRFESVLLPHEFAALEELIVTGSRELEGRVVWNVNSTAKGGGVVELLRPLLGYSRGGGVDARWVVIEGEPSFFEVTKRIHNRLHGYKGDRGSLGAREHAIYERALERNAVELAPLIGPRDIVILHDPQTAGLVEAVSRTGATVIWRCHVGLDHVNGPAHEAWGFLRRYVRFADAFVFSRAAFAWDVLPAKKVAVIPPSIDAFSPKNARQTPAQTLAILAAAGLIRHRADGNKATFTRSDGTPGRVDRKAAMIEERPLSAEDQLVMQISRWDRLKDPHGVVRAFARYIAPRSDAHLLLAGPSTESVADDPEGAKVFASVRREVRGLPYEVRSRVHLASLPMDDDEENAAIVNALQRRADVVVQKSLAEGFGLTVSEAMWKARPVVASDVGGIDDQIVEGAGILISRPRDLEAFAEAVLRLLANPVEAAKIGAAAHDRIREHFLAPQHLGRYFELIQRIAAAPKPELVPAS